MSGSMIHPLTGTLGSSSCTTHGMWSSLTALASNLNRPFHIFRCSQHMTQNLSWCAGGHRGLTVWSTPHNFGEVCGPA